MFHIKIFRFMQVLSYFSVEKTHLPIENGFYCCIFLQVILSVVALLFEITFSKISHNKIMIDSDVELKLINKFNFVYKSRCTDFNNAINKLILLRINLLRVDGLNVSFFEATKTQSDNHTEMSIL